MDASKLARLIMNPVRLRIVQHLVLHGRATCAEMGRALSDVPMASLYRHVRLLEQGEVISVESVRRVRGAVEKTYAMNRRLGEAGDASASMQQILLHVSGTFAAYFQGEGADPVRDMLFMGTSTLMLTDEEFKEMMEEIGGVMNDYLAFKPAPGRKPRRMTWISSPSEEEST